VYTLVGHTSAVDSVTFSPDGRWLASGSWDATVQIWEVASGRALRSLAGHSGAVHAVAFSPDGRILASGSLDKTVKLWEVATGREVRAMAVDSGPVVSVAFSPNGRWLASASGSKGDRDRTVELWEVASGQALRSLTGHTANVNAVTFSPNGRILASGSWDTTVKLWEVATGREERTLGGHVAPLHAVTFSPNGRFLALGSLDKTVKLWDVAGRQVSRSLGAHPAQVLSVAFSPDGRILASGSFEDTVKLWDVATGRALRNLGGDRSKRYFVDALAFSPDGRLLASAGLDYRIKLWDLAAGRVLRTLIGHTNAVYSLTFSPDGRWLATSSGDRTVKLWNVATGRPLRTFTGHAGPVRDVAFSPDGRALASASTDKTVKFWDAASGREVSTLIGHSDTVDAVSFSPDGRWLASASEDKTIRLWEVTTVTELRTLHGHTSGVTAETFSPDGTRLASASRDGSSRLWDATTGKMIALLTAMREGDEWLALTPEGLFDGSARGTETLVAWRIGNRVYPPDRFFTDYYTPGLLARIFAGERPRPKIDLAALKLPPEVRITHPAGAGTLDTKRVTIIAEAEDQGGGVAMVRLYQNGKLIGERPGKPSARSRYEFAVDLVAGENLLKVLAVTNDRVESNEDQVRVVFKSPDAGKPALHLLVVGINQYEDPAFDLGFARPDAVAIARFFEQSGGRLFSSVKAVKLLDREATKARIQEALNQVAKEARPEDVVLIYLAGHGVGLGQQFYFLPQEMRKEMDEEAAVRKYGMAASVLGETLSRTKALKQVLVLDTCQSEAALPILAKVALFRGLGAAEEKAVKMLARSNGIYLLAASTKQQYALEVPELGHGVLTYALLSGLGERGQPQAPTMGEGIVTVLSLLQYVNQAVPELTEKYHKGNKQYPVSSATGMDFPLALR
jgi:WD40 repeat protein